MGPQERKVERRLAAILAADVVGYSRLMGADETGTLHRLRSYQKEVLEPAIASRGGRIVKTMGDGLLAVFPSAVEAVACAIVVQQSIASRDTPLAEEERLRLRIGINVGDIIIEQGDIFGDGVNLAARLESLCQPGGLCISRAVRDQVRDKLKIAFEDCGEQAVKNIARPVRVFALSPEAIAALPDLPPPTQVGPDRRTAKIAAALFAFLVTVVAGAWWAMRQPVLPWPQFTETQPAARASLAVLPFASLGPDDSYFADGLTEDLIAALGRFRQLSVISRAGTSVYKGTNPSLQEVGRNLNVRYAVEGTVRRSPERIRVTVNLADTAGGRLLWSDKYEAEPKDIFSVQDRITQAITGALAVQVTAQELAQATAKPASDLEAYDLVLRGRELLFRITRSGNAQARALFEHAIERDPNYAPAYVGLGLVNLRSVLLGWTPYGADALARAESLAIKAVELDDFYPGAHALLGNVAVYQGNYERALRELKRAIELNGSDAEAYSGLMAVLLWSGDVPGAIEAGNSLMQFQPSLSAVETFHLATAFILADRTSDALNLLRSAVDHNRTNPYIHAALAIAYAQSGQKAEAEQQAALIRERYPIFSREEFGSLLRNPAHRQKLSSGLQLSGL
jgi:class 3 adenylate cyclase/TolB-like protein